MRNSEVIQQVAKELNLPYKDVKAVIDFRWKYFISLLDGNNKNILIPFLCRFKLKAKWRHLNEINKD